METIFTPGPWVVDGTYISQESDKDVGICDVLYMDAGGRTGWFRGPVTEANACAISATPDLFEAAQAAEAIFARQGWIEGSDAPEAVALRQLRAAIMKATGGVA